MDYQQIQHSKRRLRALARAQGTRRINTFYLLVAVIVAMALIALLAQVHYARAASYPPLCHRTPYGVRVQRPQTADSYRLHVEHGDWRARNGECWRFAR